MKQTIYEKLQDHTFNYIWLLGREIKNYATENIKEIKLIVPEEVFECKHPSSIGFACNKEFASMFRTKKNPCSEHSYTGCGIFRGAPLPAAIRNKIQAKLGDCHPQYSAELSRLSFEKSAHGAVTSDIADRRVFVWVPELLALSLHAPHRQILGMTAACSAEYTGGQSQAPRNIPWSRIIVEITYANALWVVRYQIYMSVIHTLVRNWSIDHVSRRSADKKEDRWHQFGTDGSNTWQCIIWL